VNEILPSGQVLHLDDIAVPKKKQKVEKKPVTETATAPAPTETVVQPAETVIQPAAQPVAQPEENGNTKVEDNADETDAISNDLDPARAAQITAEEKAELTSEERKNAAIAAVRKKTTTILGARTD